jgi:hypothetical protein
MLIAPKINKGIRETGHKENVYKVYIRCIKSKLDMIPEGTVIFDGIAAFAGYGNWYLCRVDLAKVKTLTYPVARARLGEYLMISPHVFLWSIWWSI